MEINDLCKIVEIINNGSESSSKKYDNCPWEIGKKYFIRTVTMYITGELV